MSHAKYRALGFGTFRKRLGTPSVLFISLCLAIIPCGAHASQPSSEAARAVAQISAIRPCTAAALLHVMRRSDNASNGVFYLQDIPTPSIISVLIGLEDGGADFQRQPNLYADVSFYIEVSWSIEELNEHVAILTAEAQLVRPTGVKLNPAHPIERPTRVLMAGQSLRLLPSAVVE